MSWWWGLATGAPIAQILTPSHRTCLIPEGWQDRVQAWRPGWVPYKSFKAFFLKL